MRLSFPALELFFTLKAWLLRVSALFSLMLGLTLPAYGLAPSVDKRDAANMPLLGEGPVALVRYLESIHDEVAVNKPQAEQRLRQALAKAGQEMLNFPAPVWNSAENLYALMTYLFIGGDPDIVQRLLRNIDISLIPDKVVEGALAYAYHDTPVFLQSFPDEFFNDINIPIDLRMAACLGTALEDQLDPQTALKRLDLVRTLTPGSLLEEAALRREALLAHYSDDVYLLKLLAHNYMTRFSRSPYEKLFWHGFAVSMVRMAPRLSDEQIDDFLSHVAKDMRYVILSHISRAFLVQGNFPRAHNIASKAIRLAIYEHFPSDAVRFYYAASSIGSIEIFHAKKILDGIDIDNLSAADRALFAACFALEHGIIKNNHLAPIGEQIAIAGTNTGGAEDIKSEPVKMDYEPNPQFEAYLESIKLPVPKTPHITDLTIDRENKKIEQFLKDAQIRLREIDKGWGTQP